MEKIVTFPGFGWEFHLKPVLLPITSSFGIHWYGAIIAVGFLLAVLWGCRQSSHFGIKQDHVIDMLFFAVPLGIVGARLYYVLNEFQDYRIPGDPKATIIKIVRIWDGGLAIYGGVIAAVLTVLVFCKVRKIPFLPMADIGAMGLFIGQCIGRWGNFVNVEAFGDVTSLPWRMAGPNVASYLWGTRQIEYDVYQQIVSGELGVHPTFFYESLWNLIGFLLVVFVVKKFRKFDGQIFFSYVAWYGIGRFFIERHRTDSIGPGEVRISLFVAAVSAVAAICVIVYMLAVKKADGTKLYVNLTGKAADGPSESVEEEDASAETENSAELTAEIKSKEADQDAGETS